MMSEEDIISGQEDFEGALPAAENNVSAAGNAASRQFTRSKGGAGSDYADYDIEQAVLGAVLTEPDALNTVTAVLGGLNLPEEKGRKAKKSSDDPVSSYFHSVAGVMFRDPRHALIFEAMLSVQAKKTSVDVLEVASWLERHKKLSVVGGMDKLLEIQSSVGSVANIEAWCVTLRDYAMLREMVRACSDALEICKDPTLDIKQTIDGFESRLFQVRNSFLQSEIKPFTSLLTDAFEFFMKLQSKEMEPGIATGFADLDRLTGGGLKKQEMFVLAARPSIGKTALALNIVRNIMMKETPGVPRKKVAFFSLEMSAMQVTQRLLCTESGVPFSSFLDGSFNRADTTKLTRAVTDLQKAELTIDPTGGISIFELRAKARKLKDSQGLDLLVVDYLQLMKGGDSSIESRQVEVAAISGGLKKLAKDLDIPVLVLAQLNREVEKGQGGKNAKPKLSNLRESGAIEQDADIVVFLHRERDESKEGNMENNHGCVKAELIVEKNRNGRTGIVDLEFRPSLMEFRSVDHKYSQDDVPHS